jgi:hypothetical protein
MKSNRHEFTFGEALRFLFACLFLIAAVPSLAAPEITEVSGETVDGGQVVITGAGFGSLGPNVVFFDDFGNGNPGSVHPSSATIGSWSTPACVTYEDPLLSKGKGASCIGEGGQRTGWIVFGDTTEVFISAIAYVPKGFNFPEASSPKTFPDKSAVKHFWLMNKDGYRSSASPDIKVVAWTGSTFYRVSSNDTWLSKFDQSGRVAWAWDAPVRYSLWAKGNGTESVGTDGMFQAVSSSGHELQRYKDYRNWFKDEHVTKAWDRVSLVGYARGNSSKGNNWVIDDVYVAVGAGAAARVELGDAPTYKASRKLALLTPDTWADSRIEASLREGMLVGESSGYLYVTTADGQTSANGFPVSIGTTISESFSAPPNPPLLEVQ